MTPEYTHGDEAPEPPRSHLTANLHLWPAPGAIHADECAYP